MPITILVYREFVKFSRFREDGPDQFVPHNEILLNVMMPLHFHYCHDVGENHFSFVLIEQMSVLLGIKGRNSKTMASLLFIKILVEFPPVFLAEKSNLDESLASNVLGEI